MGAVDIRDQLKSYGPGLRHQRRARWHAIWHWILITVLVNCYLFSLHSEVPHKSLYFTDQSTFRNALIDALLAEGTANLGRKELEKGSIHTQIQMKRGSQFPKIRAHTAKGKELCKLC